MKIIIDTNIYLNFYRLDSGQSLEMLKNLNKFIEDKKFKLILPKQIEDEFIRNKNSSNAIYGEHILKFQKGLDVEFKIPYLIKSSKKIEQIKNTIKKLKTLKEEAVEDYKSRVFNPSSLINQQINKLFFKANIPIESDMLLQHAYFRTLRGNPPRKNNSSFGDAIIWETILSQCVDDDLTIISGDGDFESEIECGKIHELLNAEWKKKTEKSLALYKELGSFINKYSEKKKKPIKRETIEDEDRLNSIFSQHMYVNSLGHENGSVLLGGDNVIRFGEEISPFATISGIGKKSKCSCCGESYDSSSSLGILGINKCDKCSASFDLGHKCSKCGKHYHRSVTSINIYSGKCDECQDKIYEI